MWGDQGVTGLGIAIEDFTANGNRVPICDMVAPATELAICALLAVNDTSVSWTAAPTVPPTTSWTDQP